MRIAHSPRAVADLADIGDYISKQNPPAATAVERRIRTIVELIAHFPASGRTLEERPDVRVIPLGIYPYRLFYTASGGELIILHIRHSSREPVDPGKL